MISGLGYLEETILLLVLIMERDIYGVSVKEKYEETTGKSISVPAVHTVLRRLEKKGLLTSKMGGATSERGGRQKRLFNITKYGEKVLSTIKANRDHLWSMIPKLKY